MSARIDVFISYKREERDYSERVKHALISNGYTAVTDLNIGKNEEFGDAIDTMIRTAKLTLVLWTNASASSDWVRKEARLARDLEKAGKPNRYLGVMLENVDIELPPDLRGLQMVDIHDHGIDEVGIELVIEAARDVLGSRLERDTKIAKADSQALAEEWQLYDLARTINVAASYERYLSHYPNGEFTEDAKRQLQMFTWYLHPFRRNNLSNTLAASGIIATVCVTLWAATRDPVTVGVDPGLHRTIIGERDDSIAKIIELEAALLDVSSQTPVNLVELEEERSLLLEARETLTASLAAAESDVARLSEQFDEASELAAALQSERLLLLQTQETLRANRNYETHSVPSDLPQVNSRISMETSPVFPEPSKNAQAIKLRGGEFVLTGYFGNGWYSINAAQTEFVQIRKNSRFRSISVAQGATVPNNLPEVGSRISMDTSPVFAEPSNSAKAIKLRGGEFSLTRYFGNGWYSINDMRTEFIKIDSEKKFRVLGGN